MTIERRVALDEQQRLFGDWTLPEICMNLRMAANGSSDPYRPEDVAKMLSMLKVRLATWEPGIEKYKPFDDAVRRLVEETIAEVEASS